MNKFPDDTKIGDMFWLEDEPVMVTNWNYFHNYSYYFDITFVDVLSEGKPAASMVLIPMGFDFYGATIRKMSSLEKELF